MACPFFMPIEKLENGSWLHPSRLPLGCGWSGHCTAPGHEGSVPAAEDLREFCNLGYAQGCARLPQDRAWDSIRFAVRTISDGSNNGSMRLQVRYVCERGHRPAEDGFLEFDPSKSQWIKPHFDSRLQRMAECFVESYVDKGKRREITEAAS